MALFVTGGGCESWKLSESISVICTCGSFHVVSLGPILAKLGNHGHSMVLHGSLQIQTEPLVQKS